MVALGLLPALWGAGAAVSDLHFGTRYFGANPIKEIEHFAGGWILRFLALTLAISPARRIFGVNGLAPYRRTFGLLAFVYAGIHLLVYAVLDVELSARDLVTDVAKRPYITIGMAGFLLLVPLAVTSTNGWIRRLGRRWGALHRAVYLVPILGTVHFWMSVKRDVTRPLAYALVFAALLLWRAWEATRRPR